MNNKLRAHRLLILFFISAQAEEKPASPVAKKIKNMTQEETSVALTYYRHYKYTQLTVEALERLRALATIDDEQKRLLLELADAYKAAENYAQAQKKYEEYVSLYPGSSESKRALYEAIVTCHKQMPDYRLDQEVTEKAIELGKKFMSIYPEELEYSKEIQTIIAASYRTILKHEESICSYYLQKDTWSLKETALPAARKRIEYIEKNLLKQIPEEAAQTVKVLKESLEAAEKKRALKKTKKVTLHDL